MFSATRSRAKLLSIGVMLILLQGVSYQIPASSYDKGHRLVEIVDQAISFANPIKVKTFGVDELVALHAVKVVDPNFQMCAVARELDVVSSERNPFYLLVFTKAP